MVFLEQTLLLPEQMELMDLLVWQYTMEYFSSLDMENSEKMGRMVPEVAVVVELARLEKEA